MADDIVLVKLGGSLLTEKKSQTPKIRENNIKKQTNRSGTVKIVGY